jgi:hypothetical protein
VISSVLKHGPDTSIHFRETSPEKVKRNKEGDRHIWFCCYTSHIDSLLQFIVKRTDQHDYGWEDLQVVLNTGEQCQFVHIPDLVRPYVYSCVEEEGTAWEIAIFASRYNYQDLFKLAIAAFHNADWPEWGYSTNNRLPLICLEELPLKYATALVTAMHKHKVGQFVDEEKRWRDISESFKLEDD